MANPISYKELFDFDGLEDSLKSLEQSEGQFAAAVSADLTRLSKNADKLKKSLQGIRDQLAGTNITTDSGQSQLKNLITESDRVKKSFQEQKQAIDATKSVIQANREEVARLRAEQAKLKNEYEQSRISQQKYREETARLTLESKKLDLANKQARDAVRNVSGAYKELSQTLNKARAEAKNIGVQYGVNSKQFKDAAKNVQVLDNRIKEIDTRLGQHQRNVGNYSSVLGGVRNQLGQLAAGYLSIYTAIQAIQFSFNTALKTNAIEASLTFTYKNADIAADRLNNLKNVADRLGLEFVSLADTYKSFAGAAIAANFPAKQMEHIFLSVSNAGAKMNLTTEQINGSLLAIQQMISKGNVQAEELRGQLGERLPGAFSIAARAMGVTEQELNKMLKAGEVLASDLLPRLAAELDKTFGYDKDERINTLQASWNRLINAFKEGVQENTSINSFFKTIIDGITGISKTIIRTINSTSWSEFWARLTSNEKADKIREINLSYSTGNQVLSKASDLNIGSLTKEEVTTQYTAISGAYERAKAAYDSYQKAVNEGVLKEGGKTNLKQYGQLVDALSAKMGQFAMFLPEETKKVSDKVEDAGKKGKKAAEGFAVLEEELRKLKTQLEIGLLDGTIDKSDKKVADSINKLEARINQLKKMRDDLLKPGTAMPSMPGKIQGSPGEVQSVTIDSSEFDRKQALQNLSDNQIEIEKRYAEHHARLLEDLRKKNITQLEYDAKVNELEKTKLYETYFVEKSILQKRLEAAKVGSREYLSIKRQQARLEESFQKDLNDNFFKAEDLKKRVLLETLNIVKLSTDTLGNVLGNEFRNLFDQITNDFESFVINGRLSWEDWAATASASINTVSSIFHQSSQAKIEQLEKEKEHEIKGAGDNKAAKEKIEIQYNKRIAKEKEKQAKLDRAAALFQIAINTAMAVTSVLSTGGGTRYADFGISAGILSAFVIASGAIEAAAILSRPLPKYYKGRQSGPGEFAIVNDRGTELLEYNGKYRIAGQGKETVTYLRPGEKVHTHENTKIKLSRLIDRPSISSQDRDLDRNMDKTINYTILQNKVNERDIDYDRLIRGIGSEINNIPVQENHWDERGHTRYRREKNARIKELNERNSRTGNG